MAPRLQPGFIISQGQGSWHRRQRCRARRQAAGPSRASWPPALPGGGGPKARPHHWSVQGGGLQPRSTGPGARYVLLRMGDMGDPNLLIQSLGQVLDPGSPCPHISTSACLGLEKQSPLNFFIYSTSRLGASGTGDRDWYRVLNAMSESPSSGTLWNPQVLS